MAPLNPEALIEASDAARAAARELRITAAARRMEIRRSVQVARRRRSACVATHASLSRKGDLRVRSPWSDLSWELPNESLEHVLVPLDRDT